MTGRQKILIVDDKKENLFALEKVLKETDAEIIKAASGNDALKSTLNHEFALAILDVQMPGMDGYELAEHIRSENKTRHIPIIFMSAVYSDDYYVFKGYDSGAVDYLVKPYHPKILISKVNVFLQFDRHEALRESEGRLKLALDASKQVMEELKKANQKILVQQVMGSSLLLAFAFSE